MTPKRETPPLVSVVVLNYNGGAYLEKTIPAVLDLSYPNYEVVVVDNFSHDDSLEILSRYEAKIAVIRTGENLGASRGRNIGARVARGEYLLLIDGDIVLRDKDLIERLIGRYRRDTGFLQVPIVDVGKRETRYYGVFYSIYGVNAHRKWVDVAQITSSRDELLEIAGPTAAFMFCSKERWASLGGLDESQKYNIDDVDIGPRACLLGLTNYLYTRTYVEHLGVGKTDATEAYAKRYETLFSGHARSMVINFTTANLIARFPLFLLFQVLKTAKHTAMRRSLSVPVAFGRSMWAFGQRLPDTLRRRRAIQGARKAPRDRFLYIKAPRF